MADAQPDFRRIFFFALASALVTSRTAPKIAFYPPKEPSIRQFSLYPPRTGRYTPEREFLLGNQAKRPYVKSGSSSDQTKSKNTIFSTLFADCLSKPCTIIIIFWFQVVKSGFLAKSSSPILRAAKSDRLQTGYGVPKFDKN